MKYMKRFLFVIVVLLTCCQISAQTSLADLLNGAIVNNTNTSEIIKQSISEELSIIRQQYRLARDGKTYGKNNKPYYGETYSLCVKISNGMILPISVIEPWRDDADYKRLNSSGQYKPERFWTYQRPIAKAEYSVADLEFGTDYLHPLESNRALYMHEEKKGDFGLPIDDAPGEKVGFMVWVSTNTTLQDSAMTVSIKQNPMKITASEDSAHIALNANDADKLLGGLFVVPKYERGGKIQLQIVGVAVPSDNNKKWELSLLTKGVAERNTAQSSAEVNSDSNAEPTPIESPKDDSNKKGKKKK